MRQDKHDNTHAKWGRRHPFMYAAAIPVAISYFFIWNPPASLEGNELFPYIVIMAVFARTLITASPRKPVGTWRTSTTKTDPTR